MYREQNMHSTAQLPLLSLSLSLIHAYFAHPGTGQRALSVAKSPDRRCKIFNVPLSYPAGIQRRLTAPESPKPPYLHGPCTWYRLELYLVG